MRLTWATLILGIGVLATAAMFSEQARSDDKSAATFKQKCATCHGPDGKADTPAAKAMKVRSFADPEVAKMTDEEWTDAIQNGNGKMPKFGATMYAEEIKAMVAYCRSLAK